MADHNALFLANPLAYCKNVCISLQVTGDGDYGKMGDFDLRAAHKGIYVDLKPWSDKWFVQDDQVIFSPSKQPTPNTILQAYYVPYIAYNDIRTGNVQPVLLDNVKKTNPDYRFIFTGAQNGCSLLLMQGANQGEVCAMHYPNSEGASQGYPLLAKCNKSANDILLAIDFADYGTDESPDACSFFYYAVDQWIGVTQPQCRGPVDLKRSCNSMSINRAQGVRIKSERDGLKKIS